MYNSIKIVNSYIPLAYNFMNKNSVLCSLFHL